MVPRASHFSFEVPMKYLAVHFAHRTIRSQPRNDQQPANNVNMTHCYAPSMCPVCRAQYKKEKEEAKEMKPEETQGEDGKTQESEKKPGETRGEDSKAREADKEAETKK